MKFFTTLLILTLATSLWAQEQEYNNIPCKPLAEMGSFHAGLAKAAERTDIWDWDVSYYGLEFDIDVDEELLYGQVVVQFSALTDLNIIQLDLSDNLNVDSVYFNAAGYTHNLDVLEIELDADYAWGDVVQVGIAYHGHPEATGFQAFEFGTQGNEPGGIPIISTLSEPYGARTWWPCKDVPTDKADSVSISITVPENLTAVSNGMLISSFGDGEGNRTWRWEHKYPITTYLVSLAISEYYYWDDVYHFAGGDSMLLEYWMYPSHATPSIIDRWNLTPNMMSIFEEAYGQYPYHEEKYGMAQFGWGGGHGTSDLLEYGCLWRKHHRP